MFDASAESRKAESLTEQSKPVKRFPVSPGLLFLIPIVLGLLYVGVSVQNDALAVGNPLTIGAFIFLGLALLIAFGFEFVNGFHDTANAVATVIYTHSMPPLVAVVWSGLFNFLGVLASTGAVAYNIVNLLPVNLILQVGTGVGYAMIFALLISAIVWNLGTWAVGLPNSSSHSLIGSIMGVGIANQLMVASSNAAAGIDWAQVTKIGKALIFSPIIGFVAAALLLLLMKFVIRNPKLYEAPKDQTPPPPLIRATLIAACTGVSFAHGGNDGQKGMGLIMIILISVAPMTYALNRGLPDAQVPAFVATLQKGEADFAKHAEGVAPLTVEAARATAGAAVGSKQVKSPETFAALAVLTNEIEQEIQTHGAIRNVPGEKMTQLRNDMYLVGGALNVLTGKSSKVAEAEKADFKALQKSLEKATRYIPDWVKIATALALGLGTMIGWRRIVVTVGERIGKTQMTYGQGAAAGLVAAGTIFAAERLGLPVSTTHILSSGVAGTMTANKAGLQWSTVRSIALAWVLTLPATILLAGTLYFILRQFL